MAAQQSSRGKRATGGLMEECILIDKTLLNEVIIPTMVVDRRLPDGTRHEEEGFRGGSGMRARPVVRTRRLRRQRQQ